MGIPPPDNRIVCGQRAAHSGWTRLRAIHITLIGAPSEGIDPHGGGHPSHHNHALRHLTDSDIYRDSGIVLLDCARDDAAAGLGDPPCQRIARGVVGLRAQAASSAGFEQRNLPVL